MFSNMFAALWRNKVEYIMFASTTIIVILMILVPMLCVAKYWAAKPNRLDY